MFVSLVDEQLIDDGRQSVFAFTFRFDQKSAKNTNMLPAVITKSIVDKSIFSPKFDVHFGRLSI